MPNLSLRVLACASLALPAGAQSVKLSGPLARGVAGEVLASAQASADGRYIVYTADRDGDGVFEIYSVRSNGAHAPVRLSGTVFEYLYPSPQVTSDGASVLFVADQDGNGSGELAIAAIDGSAPAVVLSGLAASGVVSWFQQSPDGARVVYLSDPDAAGVFELFSVLIGGGAPVKLDGPGGSVQHVALSSGGLASYSADRETDGQLELFVVPVDGSTPARELPVPLGPGASVILFQFDADGAHVLYIADQEELERFELFSIDTDGALPPRKLSGPLVPGGDVGNRLQIYYPFFTLSPDGSRVLYTADQETDERFELYSVPADGSHGPTKLNAPSEHDVYFETSSLDSAWVVYSTDSPDHGLSVSAELFTAPADGSAPARRISGELVPGGDAFAPQVSSDSRYVVFGADRDEDQVFELFSVPIDGATAPVQLNAPLVPGGDVEGRYRFPGFWVLGDGVAYLADQEREEFFELYLVPVTGGTVPRKLAAGPLEWAVPVAPRLQGPPGTAAGFVFLRGRELSSVPIQTRGPATVLDLLPAGDVVGSVEELELTPAGDRVVYRAREEGDHIAELHSVRTSKPFKPLDLSAELRSAFVIPTEELTPDGGRVVFETFESQWTGIGLYSSSTASEGSVVELRVPTGAGVTDSYEIAPHGDVVAFQALSALYVAPLDGSSPAVLLNPGFPAGWFLNGGLRFSADGRTLAFRAASSGVDRLYAVASDGSAPAVVVHEAQEFWSDYRFADADRLVYRTQGTVDELFVAPSDGSGPPLRLNGPLTGRRDLTAFALTPDGTRAVYLADQAADETFELFSVPTDGSAPAVPLHAALPAGHDVRDFQISSDGRRVAYRADALADEQLDIFSVPIDASRRPVQLNRNLVAAGDVVRYEITPDGLRVLYMAEDASGAIALFSTPITGPRGGVRIGRAPVPGGSVRSFRISADSSTVAFLAERNAERDLTLLAAPVDGQAAAVELAGPFQGGGSVSLFLYRISADGRVVAYVADQDTPGVFELYAAPRDADAAAPATAAR